MAGVQVLENFIDGRFVPCSRHIDSYNPATGEVHLRVPDSGEEEVQLAVEAAQRAFIKSADYHTPRHPLYIIYLLTNKLLTSFYASLSFWTWLQDRYEVFDLQETNSYPDLTLTLNPNA